MSLAPYMLWSKTRPAVRFDLAGSNLLGCDLADLPGAREALALGGANPEGWPPLVEAIARRYGRPEGGVATAVGCAGANFLAFAALVRTDDEVLVERPTYDPILGALRLLGARVARFERRWEDGWVVDPERVRRAASPRTRLIVLTSPHNPTGVLTPTDVLAELGRVAADLGARVLVDEVYLDAVYGNRPPPAASLGDGFVSTSSLTKAYGLGGLRCGWALAAPAVAESIRRVRDVVDGNSPLPTDRLGRLAFDHLDALEARARGILQPNLRRLGEFVAGRPELAWVAPPGGTVAFPLVQGETDTRGFVETLRRDHEVGLVPGAFFDAPRHFRIAFGGEPGTLEAALSRIGAALDARSGL